MWAGCNKQRFPCFSMGQTTSKNLPFSLGDLDPLSNTWFLGRTCVSPANGILISSAIFATLMNMTNRLTDRQTDHTTPSIAVGRYC